jgi:hypothetical protein
MPPITMSDRADAVEEELILALEKSPRPSKSVLYTLGEKDPTVNRDDIIDVPGEDANRKQLMRDDPRLRPMPERPQLLDFFRYRFSPANHLLQSATHALKNGLDEKTILACLLHDIAVLGFIRSDHGYWGAQMIEPYVDEEVSWAIRAHQALRFFPDESVGYGYPEMYVRMFGEGYQPEPYIVDAYNKARNHKWYMTARLITLNDIYSFDPNANPKWEDFIDIIGRNFKQPEEGLGFDNSPVAHMWRTIIWPTRAL